MSRQRPDLNRDAIAAAGLAVVDRTAPGRSMQAPWPPARGLAGMSLYHHIADRAGAGDADGRRVAVAVVPMPGPLGPLAWNGRPVAPRNNGWLRRREALPPHLGALRGAMRNATDALYRASAEHW
jgi:hypothetical protein